MSEIHIPRLAVFVTGLNLKNESIPMWYWEFGNCKSVCPTTVDVKIGKSTMLTGELASGDELNFVDLDQIEKEAKVRGYDEGFIAGYEKAQEEFKKKAEEIFFGKDKR